MKRSFFVIIILCITVQISDAQLWKLKRWEAEFGVGSSLAFTDIGGYTVGKNALGFRDLSIKQTRFDINGNIKYRISRTVNLRLGLTYGLLHSIDTRGSNEGRGMEATTSLFEPAFMGEYYFIKNKNEQSFLFLKGKNIWTLLKSLDFYGFTGIGGVGYSVKGNDVLVSRGMETGGFSAIIPFGAGATLIYTPDINFGIEFGGRYTFTDYLDGYSSQYSKRDDVYYFVNFTLTYKLKSGAKGFPTLR